MRSSRLTLRVAPVVRATRTRRGRAVTAADQATVTTTWSKITLHQRALEVSVEEEDYAAAATHRDALNQVLENADSTTAILADAYRELKSPEREARHKALDLFAKWARQEHLSVIANELLAGAEGGDGAYVELAEKAFWSATQRSGDDEADAALQTGMQMMQEGDLAGAEKLFHDMVKQFPTNVEAWNRLATVQYMRGDPGASAETCKTVLELCPTHFGAISGQGLCYYQIGEVSSALASFERVLEVHPQMPNVGKYAEVLRAMIKAKAQEQNRPSDQDSA